MASPLKPQDTLNFPGKKTVGVVVAKIRKGVVRKKITKRKRFDFPEDQR